MLGSSPKVGDISLCRYCDGRYSAATGIVLSVSVSPFRCPNFHIPPEVRNLTYFLTPHLTNFCTWPHGLPAIVSVSKRRTLSSPRRKQSSNPLDPRNRSLQSLQPFPLLPIPTFQDRNPFFQFCACFPLRRNHLIGLHEQLCAQLFQLSTRFIEFPVRSLS